MKHRTRITIEPTPQVVAALDALLSTGLFGFSRADVARRLVDEGVRAAERAGWLAFAGARRRRRAEP